MIKSLSRNEDKNKTKSDLVYRIFVVDNLKGFGKLIIFEQYIFQELINVLKNHLNKNYILNLGNFILSII